MFAEATGYRLEGASTAMADAGGADEMPTGKRKRGRRVTAVAIARRSPHSRPPCGRRLVAGADAGDVEAIDPGDRPPAGAGRAVADLPAVLRGARHVVVRPRNAPPGLPEGRLVPLTSRSPAASSRACCSAASTGGTALATDIENGFFDRLLAVADVARQHPHRPAGRRRALFGAFQALFFTLVLIPFGVARRAGAAGVARHRASAAACIGMAIGGFMAAMALKTGSAEAVQGSFPLLFIAMFFSSAFFPRQTMRGAYKAIANVNPISHLVEGIRGLVIDGLTAANVARGAADPGRHRRGVDPLALRTLDSRLAAR